MSEDNTPDFSIRTQASADMQPVYDEIRERGFSRSALDMYNNSFNVMSAVRESNVDMYTSVDQLSIRNFSEKDAYIR